MRILWLIPVLLLVAFIVFGLMELAPGTAIDNMLTYGELTDEQIEILIREHNLDRSVFYRFGIYMLNLIQGNMGYGDVTELPVWDEFIRRLPNTLLLSFTSLIIGVLISIPLGIVAARRAGTLLDNGVTVFSMIGMSMPLFWVGLLLMLLFSLRLEIVPVGGFDHGIRSLLLPGFVGSFVLMANAARQTRSNMLEVLKADYLRTARAKGLSERVVIRKHALNNAWIPIITAIGISLSNVLAGAVVIETVFTWPGIGRMAAEAVMNRDVTTTTGVVIMTTIMYVLVQLIVDVLYAFVDPRIKAQYKNYGKRKKKSTAPPKASATPVAAGGAKTAAPDNVTETPAYAADAQAAAPADVLNATEVSSAAESVKQAQAVTVAAEQPAETKTARVSYATREFEESEKSIGMKNLTAEEAALISKKYKKRNQIFEIFHHISKNKGAMAGLCILGLLVVGLIGSIFISWDSISVMSVANMYASPSLSNPFLPFGADGFGRNIFLRVIYGTRYTFAIGLGAVMFGAIFGITAGSIAGYYGGKVDDLILRASDVIASIPGILLGMVVVTVLGQSLPNLVIAVGIPNVPIYLRMARASTMTVRNNEYVEAARAIGFSDTRIIFSQVLPNGLAPLIVALTASLGISIINASSLSFLGFGVPTVYPEWGNIIAAGRGPIRVAPWITTFPGIFIMMTVLAFNLLGDGLRDALDPKLKKR